MNRRCNEQTLIKKENNCIYFITFWKNVHQQFIISRGVIGGCTYTVNNSITVTKDKGNETYINCRKNGWMKFKDSDISFMSNWLGEILF